MDEAQPLALDRDKPASDLVRRASVCSALPAGFVPLRLVLQPSCATVELVQPEVLVGRHSTADVRLPLPDVSRRHCRLVFAEGSWRVIDLHSLNGVYLNDQPVRQSTLQPGDLLRIGGFTFLIEIGDLKANSTQGLILNLFRTMPGGPLPRRAS